MDARVEDFLNDKLQTEADLGSVDALLETAKQHQALLKKQVGSYCKCNHLSLLTIQS